MIGSGEAVKPLEPNLDAVTTRKLLEEAKRRLPYFNPPSSTLVERNVSTLRGDIELALDRLPIDILDYRPEYR